MQFALCGPNQGKTMKLGGFVFRDGLAELPDDAVDAHNLMRNFYEAHPVHLLTQTEDGALVLKDVEAPRRLAAVPVVRPAAATPADGTGTGTGTGPVEIHGGKQVGEDGGVHHAKPGKDKK